MPSCARSSIGLIERLSLSRSRVRRRGAGCSPTAATSRPSVCSPPMPRASFPGTARIRSCGSRPIRAWCLRPDELHVSRRSLGARERAAPYRITMDTAFESGDRRLPRYAAPGTGRHLDQRRHAGRPTAALHELGFAHSVEAWSETRRRPAGRRALRGLDRARVLRRVDVRARAPDASKLAFASLVRQLDELGLRARRLPGATRSTSRVSGRRSGPRAEFLEALDTGPRGRHTSGSLAIRLTRAGCASGRRADGGIRSRAAAPGGVGRSCRDGRSAPRRRRPRPRL